MLSSTLQHGTIVLHETNWTERSSVWMTMWPNNSPEPPPIDAVRPPSRLTGWAARLSFCR